MPGSHAYSQWLHAYASETHQFPGVSDHVATGDLTRSALCWHSWKGHRSQTCRRTIPIDARAAAGAMLWQPRRRRGRAWPWRDSCSPPMTTRCSCACCGVLPLPTCDFDDTSCAISCFPPANLDDEVLLRMLRCLTSDMPLQICTLMIHRARPAALHQPDLAGLRISTATARCSRLYNILHNHSRHTIADKHDTYDQQKIF